jgi:fibro-slime domain-containing protein
MTMADSTSGGGSSKTNTPNAGGSKTTGSVSGINSSKGGSSELTISTSGVSELAKNCGNGKLDANEQCDDGNKDGGDGCTKLCQIEAEYECPEVGQACKSSAQCGDGKLASTEKCDDGNTDGDDGCSGDCQSVDEGWQCRVPGQKCVPLCGDSQLKGTEKCDDGNTDSGDGCSSVCLKEPGFDCPDVGKACTATKCGNGTKEGDEGCDDGDKNGLINGDGTGCSKTCTKAPNCRPDGKYGACTTACGDGNKDDGEECDDANTSDADGCSSDCKIEAGFTCKDSEMKDTTKCSSGTGECLVLPITFRDFNSQNEKTNPHPDFFYMGATLNGTKTICVPNASGRDQGSSGTCPGNDSTALCLGLVKSALDGTTGKPAANTDRSGGLTCACQYTDWDKTGVLTGATDGTTKTCSSGGSGDITSITIPKVQVIKSADTFKEWYTDGSSRKTLIDKLELAQVSNSNQYKFSSSDGRSVYDDIHDIYYAKNGGTPKASANPVSSLTSGFFPKIMDDDGNPKVCNLWPYWTAASSCKGTQWDARANDGSGASVDNVTGVMRNFYFTSEVRYLFRYAGNESLQFFGDDDVWVFLNGKLILDLGAPHERLQGTVTLSSSGSSATVQAQDVVKGTFSTVGTAQTVAAKDLNLEVGKIYEIAVFHADRHPRESNYQLTVSGFSTVRTSCSPRCGDGIVTAGEECDKGDDGNKDAGSSDAYNGCTKECKFGPYCGDGEKQEDNGEECDKGTKNGDPYGVADGCTNDCKKVHYCGDKVIDAAFGEECDGGTGCTADCHLNMSLI